MTGQIEIIKMNLDQLRADAARAKDDAEIIVALCDQLKTAISQAAAYEKALVDANAENMRLTDLVNSPVKAPEAVLGADVSP